MWDALFTGGAAWFSVPAIIGTLIFALKLVLMLVGGSDDLDLGGDASAGHAGHMADPNDALHGHGGLLAVASLQGVSAFAMGFGWAGLGGLQTLKWPVMGAVGLGVVGGLAMVGLFLALLRGTRALQSSGNVNMATAVGAQGSVYANVPEAGQGRGQVKVIVSGRMRVLQATSTGPALSTGSRVKVARVNPDNSVVVSPEE